MKAQIVQGTGYLHHAVRKAKFGVTKYVFDTMTAFHTSQGMLNDNAGGSYEAIAEDLRDLQFTAFGLFGGLPRQDSGRFVALKTRIFAQGGKIRIDNARLIRLFLVVFLAHFGGRQEHDFPAMQVDEYQVFIGVRFFCHCSALAVPFCRADVGDAVRYHR